MLQRSVIRFWVSGTPLRPLLISLSVQVHSPLQWPRFELSALHFNQHRDQSAHFGRGMPFALIHRQWHPYTFPFLNPACPVNDKHIYIYIYRSSARNLLLFIRFRDEKFNARLTDDSIARDNSNITKLSFSIPRVILFKFKYYIFLYFPFTRDKLCKYSKGTFSSIPTKISYVHALFVHIYIHPRI